MPSQDIQQNVARIVKDILDKAGFQCTIEIVQPSPHNELFAVSVDLQDNAPLLIGKNGNNLRALECLAKIVALRELPHLDVRDINFIIDIDNYRRSKTDRLIGLARDIAQRVMRTHKAEALVAMSAYERRVVHMELASYQEIQTESIGEEPRRRIVVKPESFV